jgi:hypothetical protein
LQAIETKGAHSLHPGNEPLSHLSPSIPPANIQNEGLLYDLSTPLHLGIKYSATQNQCYAIPNDDRHQPIQNSIDQPEGDTDDKKQTESQAYLMGALEFEKPPYLWDHSHSR